MNIQDKFFAEKKPGSWIFLNESYLVILRIMYANIFPYEGKIL